MQLVMGFVVGVVCLAACFFFSLCLMEKAKNDPFIPEAFTRKRAKKKPKDITEEELWKKEQRLPPLDPS